MALFIGIDPDVSRPSAAAIELDLEVVSGFDIECLARPRLLSVCLVRAPKEASAGFREMTSTERGLREVALELPAWLTRMLSIGGPAAMACVESSQPYYGSGKSPNWRSLLSNSQMCGACAAVVRLYCGCEVVTPDTLEWKKSTPKDLSHSRAFDQLGILHKPWPKRKNQKRAPFSLPASEDARDDLARESLSKTNPGDWEDLSDAVALALWIARKTREAVASSLGLIG